MKIALITGSARRIGRAIACSLHQAGYQIMIHAHHAKEEAQALCQLLNKHRAQSTTVCFADLQDRDTPALLIEETNQRFGQLDLLVNNASVFVRDSQLTTDADVTQLWQINTHAPHALSLAAYPFLSAQQGAIINLTDIHAYHPLKDYLIYCQTKAALSDQTYTLAQSFAPTVRVNAVAPGAIAWPEGNNQLSATIQKKIIAETPLKRHGEPNDVAQCVLFLAQHPFITGQIIHVDGGRSLAFKDENSL